MGKPDFKSKAVLLFILIIVVYQPLGTKIEIQASSLQPHPPIIIYGNEELTLENGVVGGRGTPRDPFVIEGWDISPPYGYAGVNLSGTDAWVVIRDVLVRGSDNSIGFNFVGVSNVRIESVNSSASDEGIFLHSSKHVDISRAVIFQNPKNSKTGIHLYNSANITISDSKISIEEDAAVLVDTSSNVTLARNDISSNLGPGLRIQSSRGTTLFENTLSSNRGAAVGLVQSEDVRMFSNTFVSGGITLSGTQPSHFRHTISRDNIVNGRSLHFYNDCDNLDLDQPFAGQLIIANCKNVHVSNFDIDNTSAAVQIFFSQNVTMENGHVSNSGVGLVIGYSSSVLVVGSTIERNYWGVNTYFSSNLVHHHNNFMENILQAREFLNGGNVSWDAGYPIGGNFWSDYTGIDYCSGPDQNQCSNPDGFGDSKHQGDRYPLMMPVASSSFHDIAIMDISPSKTTILQGNNLDFTVTVLNQGNLSETFGVTLSANHTQIGSRTVTLLPPGTARTLGFSWSTVWLSPGSYSITANTTLIFGGTDASSNKKTGPPVTVEQDTIPPTWPIGTTLRALTVRSVGLKLEWSPATDNGVVVEYRLYQNSYLLGSFTDLAATVTGLNPDTDYAFKVEAVDGGTNLTSDGPSLTVRTPSDANPPTWSPSSSLTVSTAFNSTTSFWVATLSWWPAASDDVQVTNYRLVQDGRVVAVMPGDARYYVIVGLMPTTTHSFKVEAGDLEGNWSTDGPSANVSLSPCQGACIYYGLNYTGIPSPGHSVTFLNGFTDGGTTRVRVTRVEISSDFGLFTWASPIPSCVAISLDCEFPGAVNLNTGEKKLLEIRMDIPPGVIPGNYTLVSTVSWEDLEQQRDYLYGTSFWVWSAAPPLHLRGFIVITESPPTPPSAQPPPDTTSPPGTNEPSQGPLFSTLVLSLLSPSALSVVVGGLVLAAFTAIVIMKERRKTRRANVGRT